MTQTLWTHLWNQAFPVSCKTPQAFSKDVMNRGLLISVLVLTVGLGGCVNNPNYAALSKSPVSSGSSRLQVKPGTVSIQKAPTKLGSTTSGTQTGKWYTVTKGDTIYSIAMRFDLDFRGLAQANDIGSDFHLAIGQRIKLSDVVAASNPQPSTVPANNSTTNGQAANSGAVKSDQKSSQPLASIANNAALIVWQWPLNRNIVKTDASITTQLKGIDISGSIGETIVATAPGVVVFAGSGLRGYGNLVIVQHSGNYLSAYAYASELLVKEKQTLAAGDPVALMGRANVASEPALHFEIRKDGKPLNPLSFLP